VTGGEARGSRVAVWQSCMTLCVTMQASEGRFARSLRVLISVFADPMSAGLLSAHQAGAIFRNIHTIRDTHNQLRALLDAASEADSVAAGIDKIARGFRNGESVLRAAYLPYLHSRTAAKTTLEAVAALPEVASFLQSAAEADERVRHTPLDALLDKPLERLNEIKCLLDDFVALSEPGDSSAIAASNARDVVNSLIVDGSLPSLSDPGPSPAKAPSPPPATASRSIQRELTADTASRIEAETRGVFSPTTRRGAPPPSVAAADARASAAIDVPVYVPGQSADVSVTATSLTQEDVDRAQREMSDAEARLAGAEAALATGREQLRRAQTAAEERGAERAAADAEAERDAMEEALDRLHAEERTLYERLAQSDSREMFESFLRKKRELQAEEDRLLALLEQHEATLSDLRDRLAAPPESVLPSDPVKRRLYIAWKSALRDREEILRQARARKHRLMRDLREQHETQVILLEMQRRAAVDGLREAVDEERRKAETYRTEIADLDKQIEEARSTMKSFRKEFEDLRVALLVDRMAKASQVATLTQRRKQLEEEAHRFQDQVEAAKQRIAAEEAARWEARLQSVREDGNRRVAEVRAKGRERLERVKADMARSFEESFKPLLEDAERRHRAELERVERLKKELKGKEAELRDAEAQASAAGGADTDDTKADDEEGEVPEWKQREFEDLKRYVTDMWTRLEVPDEDVVAFLSECELVAPFNHRVLDMYRDMYRRLTDGDAELVGPAEAEDEKPAPPTNAVGSRDDLFRDLIPETSPPKEAPEPKRSPKAAVVGSPSPLKPERAAATIDPTLAFRRLGSSLPPSLGGAGARRVRAVGKS
jgi:hypothetical protein